MKVHIYNKIQGSNFLPLTLCGTVIVDGIYTCITPEKANDKDMLCEQCMNLFNLNKETNGHKN